MLSRRGRFNLKPNLAKGGQKSVVPEDTKPNIAELKSSSVEVKEHTIIVQKTEETDIKNVMSYTINVKKEETTRIDEPHEFVVPKELIVKTSIEEETASWPPAETKRISRITERPPSPTRSDYSEISPERIEKRNAKKNFNGEEELDTKTMRIMDMIYWNPKKGHTLTRKKEKAMDQTRDSTPLSPSKSEQSSPTKTAAPQVKIGPDGTLILDETSLHMPNASHNETSAWEVVDDDRMARKVTSLSFRNRLWRKGTQWTEKETELFYEILRCTGPDFGLMHEYFPGRARCELKSKYNREEKTNWNKLKEILSMPLVLDDSLMNRVERIQKEIDVEAEEKLKSKKRKSAKNPPDTTKLEEPARIDWDENKANLEAEAEEIIHQLEKETRREEREAMGEESDSSISAAESSGDEGFVQISRAEKNKKKYAEDARKIIAALRKQSREMFSAKKKQKTEEIIIPNPIEEVPEIIEDPFEIREVYPIASGSREGINDPVLIRAARMAIRANERRTATRKIQLPKPNLTVAKEVPSTSSTTNQEEVKIEEEEEDEEINVVDDDPDEIMPLIAPAELPAAPIAQPPVVAEAELNLIGRPKALSRRRPAPNLPKRPRIE